jgi:hypothetical protein
MTTKKYHCHLLNIDRIVGIETIQCVDDAAALIEADRILAASPYTTIEVWDGGRKISLLSRSETAA